MQRQARERDRRLRLRRPVEGLRLPLLRGRPIGQALHRHRAGRDGNVVAEHLRAWSLHCVRDHRVLADDPRRSRIEVHLAGRVDHLLGQYLLECGRGLGVRGHEQLPVKPVTVRPVEHPGARDVDPPIGVGLDGERENDPRRGRRRSSTGEDHGRTGDDEAGEERGGGRACTCAYPRDARHRGPAMPHIRSSGGQHDFRRGDGRRELGRDPRRVVVDRAVVRARPSRCGHGHRHGHRHRHRHTVSSSRAVPRQTKGGGRSFDQLTA